jgi:hypothetical protein
MQDQISYVRKGLYNIAVIRGLFLINVPRRGLEPLHLTAYAPQAYLYTIPTPGHAILPENNQDKRLSYWRQIWE